MWYYRIVCIFVVYHQSFHYLQLQYDATFPCQQACICMAFSEAPDFKHYHLKFYFAFILPQFLTEFAQIFQCSQFIFRLLIILLQKNEISNKQSYTTRII